MVCPRCQSDNVLAERHAGSSYRGYRYTGLALVLDHLLHLLKEQSFQEDGAVCACMRCGYQWQPKREVRHARYVQILTEHLGKLYRGVQFKGPEGEALQLEAVEIALYDSKGKRRVIALDELAAVAYQKSLGPLYGWLTVRDRVHANRRMPQNFKQAMRDPYTVFCDFDHEKACYQTYLALREIVAENRRSGLLR